MQGCFIFNRGGGCFSDEGASFLSWGGGGSKKMIGVPPHYGKTCGQYSYVKLLT